MAGAASTDADAIDTLVAAFYAAFDNRHGRPPDLAALAGMFDTGALVSRVEGDTLSRMTVDEFIAPRAVLLTGGRLVDFHEWEAHGRTTVLGGIAERVSHYEKCGVLDGADYRGAGRKILTFRRTSGGWRIHAVLWEDDAVVSAAR